MLDMDQQLQHLKLKEYYKASNEQRSINTHQGNFDILEEVMNSKHEDRWQKMHFLGEDLSETNKKSSETVAGTTCEAHCKISEM